MNVMLVGQSVTSFCSQHDIALFILASQNLVKVLLLGLSIS